MTLRLLSEPYNPLGNIAAEGISKLLGRSDLDFLELVIRESGQNVWDARLSRDARPRYVARVRAFDESQMRVLHDQVFSQLPEGDNRYCLPKLRTFVNQKIGEVLEIADYGTRGLGGPTNASYAPVGEEPTDFVDLIRNIGSRRDIAQGGGTYGYGKASLYAVSSCRTLIFDSQTVEGGSPERRLIGAALGKDYEKQGRLFTGRHWWGKRDGQSMIDPLSGTQADELASALGFFERGPEERGTTIAILDPDWAGLLNGDFDVGALDPSAIRERVARRIVEILLDNFWPKMLPKTLGGQPAMDFEVLRERDHPVPLPPPDTVPPLDLYADAWRRVQGRIRGDEAEGVHEITRHHHRTGWLGIARRSGRRPVQTRRYRLRADGRTNRSHHVALMRPAELVVCYKPESPPEDDGPEWAGVFIADPDDEVVEQAFADAEPPAHNFWSPDNVSTEDRTGKSIVRVSLRQIGKITEQIGTLPVGDEETPVNGAAPLARASQTLGNFLRGTAPTGGAPGDARRREAGGGGGDSPIEPLEYAGLELVGGDRVARFRTALRRPVGELTLHCRPLVVLEGRKELQTPDGTRPEIRGWLVDNATVDAGDDLRMQDGKANTAIEVLISVPEGYAIEASVSFDEGAPG